MRGVGLICLAAVWGACSFAYHSTANFAPQGAGTDGPPGTQASRDFDYPIRARVLDASPQGVGERVATFLSGSDRFVVDVERFDGATDTDASACEGGRAAAADTVIVLLGKETDVFMDHACAVDLMRPKGPCSRGRELGYVGTSTVRIRYLRTDTCVLLHEEEVTGRAEHFDAQATAMASAESNLVAQLRLRIEHARDGLYAGRAVIESVHPAGVARAHSSVVTDGSVYLAERRGQSVGFTLGRAGAGAGELEPLFGLQMAPGDAIRDTGLRGFLDIRPHVSLLGVERDSAREVLGGVGAQVRYKHGLQGFTAASSVSWHAIGDAGIPLWDVDVGYHKLVVPSRLWLDLGVGAFLADLARDDATPPFVGLSVHAGTELRLWARWFLSGELGYQQGGTHEVDPEVFSASQLSVRGPFARMGILWRFL